MMYEPVPENETVARCQVCGQPLLGEHYCSRRSARFIDSVSSPDLSLRPTHTFFTRVPLSPEEQRKDRERAMRQHRKDWVTETAQRALLNILRKEGLIVPEHAAKTAATAALSLALRLEDAKAAPWTDEETL